MLRNHPLFQTLRELKGNPRVTVLTEIMFGIPYNLFMPFFSVYMLSLGVTDRQIGSIASMGLVAQIFTALLSGAIVDKFGRRLTLFVSDLLCWSLPALIWFMAQDVRYFVVAALLNSFWRISHTAWTCLMVEDAEERHLVHIWTWIMIFAFSSAFFAPLGGWFVERYGLIPAARGLFFFGFIMLAGKVILLYVFSHETARGKQRMQETRHRSLFSLLAEYRTVVRHILHSPAILASIALLAIINIYGTINNNFWGVLFSTRLGFPESQISLFAAIRSVVMTLGFFLVGPRLTNLLHFRLPMAAGFGAFLLSQVLLVLMPPRAVGLLVISVMLEGAAVALVNPMAESLLAVSMDTEERARLTAMVSIVMIVLISPFGWIAGQLSALNRSYPFLLNVGLFTLGLLLVWIIGKPGLITFVKQPDNQQP